MRYQIGNPNPLCFACQIPSRGGVICCKHGYFTGIHARAREERLVAIARAQMTDIKHEAQQRAV